jgi:hypothetical protein
MHKQMVSLTDSQIEFLKEEARVLGVSVSDLIRRIVDGHRVRIRESKEESRHFVMIARGRVNEGREEMKL